MFNLGQMVAFLEEPYKSIGGVVDSNESKTIVAAAGQRKEYDTSALVVWEKKPNKQKEYAEFERELSDLVKVAKDALTRILLSPDRIRKHQPYTWTAEPEDGHLNKAARHILTHQLIRDGNSPNDDEQHLDNAITRLLMAASKK